MATSSNFANLTAVRLAYALYFCHTCTHVTLLNFGIQMKCEYVFHYYITVHTRSFLSEYHQLPTHYGLLSKNNWGLVTRGHICLSRHVLSWHSLSISALNISIFYSTGANPQYICQHNSYIQCHWAVIRWKFKSHVHKSCLEFSQLHHFANSSW